MRHHDDWSYEEWMDAAEETNASGKIPGAKDGDDGADHGDTKTGRSK